MADKTFPPGVQLSQLGDPHYFDKYINNMQDQPTFFPRSISLEDIDRATTAWFNSGKLIIDDIKVPVFFLTQEKWAEFKQTWEYVDEDRNVEYPYVTIHRTHNPRLSTNPVKHRIPGKTFTTYKFPVSTNAGGTFKYYKVPQPIKVELDYEIRILTHYTSDINVINETLLRHFASLQAYLNIDNHYMSMVIDNVSDESDSDNLEDERVIHTLYSIMVKGYIIDETEFEEKTGVASLLIDIKEQIS